MESNVNVKVIMKQREVTTLDEKIKIVDKSRGGMNAAAVDLIFR
jgi:hypothetical protein